MIPSVRWSGFKDYVAIDFLDCDDNITSTPFYIQEGQQIKVHWLCPKSELPKAPNRNDYVDVFTFKMEGGKLYAKWHQSFTEIKSPEELLDYEFHKAKKIEPSTPIQTFLTYAPLPRSIPGCRGC